MNLDESLRELFWKMSWAYGGTFPEKYEEVFHVDEDFDIDKAIAKIKALVVESLPKEQDIAKGYPDSFAFKSGYNACLGEIKSIWE